MDKNSPNNITVPAPLSNDGMKNGIRLSADIKPAAVAWLVSNKLTNNITHSIVVGKNLVSLPIKFNPQLPKVAIAVPPTTNVAINTPMLYTK